MKDPLRLRYFRLQAEEMALLRLLDGRSTWGQIVERLQFEFRRQFSEQNLAAFLTSTINNSLLTSDQPGQGNRLMHLVNRAKSARWKQRLMAALSVRWHGVDPTALLNWTNAVFGWFFSPRAIACSMLFVMLVTTTMLVRLPMIEADLPRFSEIATVTNLPYLIAAFVLIKLLHELGHGTACRRFGGECHELGILFIACFPLMYCDVSDAWLFRERWKRVVVSAAGILIELFVAAVAALLWMASVPGVAHTFFLNIAIVASVNTLLINGNPLLRYDGYYVLADSLGIANLGAESRRAASNLFDRLVLGIPRERVSRHSGGAELALIAFGAASAVYRLLVIALILWMLFVMAEPYGLGAVVVLVAAATGSGVVMQGVTAVRTRMKHVEGRSDARIRASVGAAVFGGFLLAALLFPLHRTVVAPFVVTAGQSLPVYVTVPGRLEQVASAGQWVEQGDVLAVLSNAELRSAYVKAEGELAEQKQHLQQLLTLRSIDPNVAKRIPMAREAVQSAETLVATVGSRVDDLTIRAERAGYVMPPRREMGFDENGERLSGTPLDRSSLGRWLDEQTLVCWVGNRDDVRLVASVEEVRVPFVERDAIARVKFASAPQSQVTATVAKIASRSEVDVAPELLIAGAIAGTGPAAQSVGRSRYRVDLKMTEDDSRKIEKLALPAPLYSTGNVVIECGSASLLERFWLLFCHTFAIRVK